MSHDANTPRKVHTVRTLAAPVGSEAIPGIRRPSVPAFTPEVIASIAGPNGAYYASRFEAPVHMATRDKFTPSWNHAAFWGHGFWLMSRGMRGEGISLLAAMLGSAMLVFPPFVFMWLCGRYGNAFYVRRLYKAWGEAAAQAAPGEAPLDTDAIRAVAGRRVWPWLLYGLGVALVLAGAGGGLWAMKRM